MVRWFDLLIMKEVQILPEKVNQGSLYSFSNKPELINIEEFKLI